MYLYYTCAQIALLEFVKVTGGNARKEALEQNKFANRFNIRGNDMDQCDLSIIIPIYNGERFLRNTLDSVLKQSYKNFELILVDDGSTDSTSSICDEYAAKDSRIRVRHQKNAGMSKARDAGVQMSMQSTSIAFLDGDDIFASNMFEDMMRYKEYDLVQVCSRHVNTDRILEYKLEVDTPKIENVTGKRLLYRFFYPGENKGDIGYLWGLLINRNFYRKMESIIRKAESILPQNYLNDVYCVPRFLLNTKKVALLNEVYILHRISRYTDSRIIKPNALHYELALANKMNLEYYRKHKCEFAYQKQIVGFYLVILKIWYQTITSENDREKQREYVKLVQRYYKEYYMDLKSVKCRTIHDYLVVWSIKLFGFNKLMWRFIVGNIRYGLMYQLQV